MLIYDAAHLLLRLCRRLLPCALLLPLLAACGSSGSSAPPAAELTYPATATVEHTDFYHGVEVADPYRWLEDQEATAVLDWVGQQDELFRGYVDEVPSLAQLESRLQEIQTFDRSTVPVRRGEQYFYTHQAAGQPHPVLMVRGGVDGEPRQILDTHERLADGPLRFGGFAASPDGAHIAWMRTDAAGVGWFEILRSEDGSALEEQLEGVGAGAVWSADGAGFFYQSMDGWQDIHSTQADIKNVLRYHRLGTPQSADQVIFSPVSKPNPVLAHRLSNDGNFLVMTIYRGSRTRNSMHYLDLRDGVHDEWTELIDGDANFFFVGNQGRTFLVQTTLDAELGRLVAIDLDQPTRDRWRELIPQRESTLAAVSHIGNRLVVTSTLDARPTVEIFRADGTHEANVELPSLGLLSGFNNDAKATVTHYRVNSLIDPGTIYQLDLETALSSVHQRSKLAFDPDALVIRQEFYRGLDGTRIPIFLAHRRDLDPDRPHPLFMYGYGHAGWVAFPWFQPHLIAWLENGGVYALPGLRGGGEYGRAWHQAGTRRHKQTTIDDFIAAAEFLVDRGYTNAQLQVANGGSASGVLAAAAVIQRPDLFGAALIEYPFLDMLRYQHFTTIKGWTGGYGTSEDRGDFDVLKSYSPLHKLDAEECLPPMLTVVAEKDSSTAPMHGYKFTAAAQHRSSCGAPYLLSFIPEVGHYSYGSTTEERSRNQAEILAFLIRSLDLDWT